MELEITKLPVKELTQGEMMNKVHNAVHQSISTYIPAHMYPKDVELLAGEIYTDGQYRYVEKETK